ncbi:MAG: fumarate reductase cytochrome b subunit [Helicobacteraceae bacterium]
MNVLEAFSGKTAQNTKSKIPAKLDYIQSATGLFLGLFMMAHMIFVSSILVSKDAMYFVTKMMEGSPIIKDGQPALVSVMAGIVFAIFIIHAGVAMRKFPINYEQFMKFYVHMRTFKHSDTTYWFIQVLTGFVMFFLGSVHLYIMMTQPQNIGPYGSADRMWSDHMWPLYLVLLFAVELHGSIGLYRLVVKWGWFDGREPKKRRAALQKFKLGISAFFITLGLLTLAAYMKIGIEHAPNYGEKYTPTYKTEAR